MEQIPHAAATVDVVLARPDRLAEADFARAYADLPLWRQERADRYLQKKDRYASVVAFSLLQFLWRERDEGPIPDVVRDTHGKPRFAGKPSWHFNWSHDRSVCVCAFGPTPLGVDVQSRVRYDDGLFARIAAPGEHVLGDRLREADDLSSLWTRKEAVVKRTGRGLLTPLEEVDTVATEDILTFSCTEPRCHLSISVEGRTARQLRPRLRLRSLRPAPGPDIWSEAEHHHPDFADLRSAPSPSRGGLE